MAGPVIRMIWVRTQKLEIATHRSLKGLVVTHESEVNLVWFLMFTYASAYLLLGPVEDFECPAVQT